MRVLGIARGLRSAKCVPGSTPTGASGGGARAGRTVARTTKPTSSLASPVTLPPPTYALPFFTTPPSRPSLSQDSSRRTPLPCPLPSCPQPSKLDGRSRSLAGRHRRRFRLCCRRRRRCSSSSCRRSPVDQPVRARLGLRAPAGQRRLARQRRRRLARRRPRLWPVQAGPQALHPVRSACCLPLLVPLSSSPRGVTDGSPFPDLLAGMKRWPTGASTPSCRRYVPPFAVERGVVARWAVWPGLARGHLTTPPAASAELVPPCSSD